MHVHVPLNKIQYVRLLHADECVCVCECVCMTDSAVNEPVSRGGSDCALI